MSHGFGWPKVSQSTFLLRAHSEAAKIGPLLIDSFKKHDFLRISWGLTKNSENFAVGNLFGPSPEKFEIFRFGLGPIPISAANRVLELAERVAHFEQR